jgi:hypothetical protein
MFYVALFAEVDFEHDCTVVVQCNIGLLSGLTSDRSPKKQLIDLTD